jgi:uncharacterized protein with von Willebrand factor type A (vWA) domain
MAKKGIPGHLAENVLHFVRVLRGAGMALGPAKVLDALAAVQATGIDNREDFRAALCAVLVSRRDQVELFDQAFDLFWRHPRLVEKMIAALLPRVHSRTGATPPPAIPERLAQALLGERAARPPEGERELELDAAFTFSPREILQRKDFATMSAAELAQIRAMLARLRLPLPRRRVRRTEPAHRGHVVDLRATLRGMAGAAGMATPLRLRARRREVPPLVVLCDISGSMDRYSRMLLHFLHAVTNDRHRVHVLVFGTRLTNITRHLKHRDVDVALARVTRAVADWAGGTRIGAALAVFNRRWSRRLLGQNAVVLLISDGLDADAGAGVGFEMERLSKSCSRLVWLNPLLGYARFEPRAAGVRAMLPHVDDFLPVHNLHSIRQLDAAFSQRPSSQAIAASRSGRMRAFQPRLRHASS